MSGQNGANFPIQGDEDIVISAVNEVWGREGAGSVKFWEKWDPYVLRDSATQTGGLDSVNGYYDLIATRGASYEYKGELEARNFEATGGQILIGPARSERIDGPAVLFNAVKSGGARRRRFEEAISNDMRLWGEHLPMRQIIGLMVNSRLSTKHPTLSGNSYVYTKGTTFFSTSHRVNPMDEGNTAVFSNLITLGAPWSESGWATVKDTILQTPDMDGQTLRNADGLRPPLAMVATTAQAIRLAHIFGPVGSGTTNFLVENANQNAGISSVIVGEVEIMVNPYLLTLAEAANQATVRKRTYLFPGGGGRKAFIWREVLAPRIDRTGGDSMLRHLNNAEALYIQAEATAIYGEPRSCYAVDEP